MNPSPIKIQRRPVRFLVIILVSLITFDTGLYLFSLKQQSLQNKNLHLLDIATSGLGLSDLCVSTEARYTRHPAASDSLAPFMDHPGAIEHFPTGSFWAPPPPAELLEK